MDLATTMLTSLQGVGRLVIIASAGWMLNRIGSLDEGRRKGMSKVSLACLLPCLLFTNVASSVSPSSIVQLIVAPAFAAVFSVLAVTFGGLVGRAMARPTDTFLSKHIQAVIGFGNHGTIPLVLLPAVLESDPFGYRETMGPLEATARIEEDVTHAFSVISIFMAVMSISTWSQGFGILSEAADELDRREALEDEAEERLALEQAAAAALALVPVPPLDAPPANSRPDGPVRANPAPESSSASVVSSAPAAAGIGFSATRATAATSTTANSTAPSTAPQATAILVAESGPLSSRPPAAPSARLLASGADDEEAGGASGFAPLVAATPPITRTPASTPGTTPGISPPTLTGSPSGSSRPVGLRMIRATSATADAPPSLHGSPRVPRARTRTISRSGSVEDLVGFTLSTPREEAPTESRLRSRMPSTESTGPSAAAAAAALALGAPLAPFAPTAPTWVAGMSGRSLSTSSTSSVATAAAGTATAASAASASAAPPSDESGAAPTAAALWPVPMPMPAPPRFPDASLLSPVPEEPRGSDSVSATPTTGASAGATPPSSSSSTLSPMPPVSTIWSRTVESLHNPPVLAALLGVLIGLVTPVKELLFTSSEMKAEGRAAPLNILFTRSLVSLGEAVNPLTLVVLGSTMADLLLGPAPKAAATNTAASRHRHAERDSPRTPRPTPWAERAHHGLRALEAHARAFGRAAVWAGRGVLSAFTLRDPPGAPPRVRRAVMWAILVTRLLLLPVLGSAALVGLAWAGILDRSDRVLFLTLLIQTTPPVAMNLSLICEVVGRGQMEVASVILWQYLACSVTITLWTSGFITLLNSDLLP